MSYLRKTQELAIRHVAARLLAGGNRNYSKDYASSSDDEKDSKKSGSNKKKPEKSEKAQTEESASAKLNRLLASMQTADDHMNFAKRPDIVVKPGEANRNRKVLLKEEVESKDIFSAARKVASLLGDGKDQQQQTESELLTRLLGSKQSSTSSPSEEQKVSVTSNESDINLSELIVGMKIDRQQQQKEHLTTRSDYVRRSLAAKGRQQQQNRREQNYSKEGLPTQRKRGAEAFTGSVNLFGSQPLGIFTDPLTLKDSPDLLPTWSHLQQQALKIQVSHPPANYFDKIANWTEQGKVWRFPIDNEQDWLDEKDVDFSEHIFLEQHLEGWCPNRGPVRHFMELVCVGLSKNPYITAKEKKEHIMWYRDYFESKRDILKELMDNKKIDGDHQQKLDVA